MDTKTIVKLCVGSVCMVGGLVFPPLQAAQPIVWGQILATALGNVAAGNTANAIDDLIKGMGRGKVSLENHDLTKAVGEAIAVVITLGAKKYKGDTHKNLNKIAVYCKNNWVKIAQQELIQQVYPQLREASLDKFLTPEEYSLTQDGNLSAQEWEDIFRRLNMAAGKGGGFELPAEVYPEIAELLHTTFPKALRELLKEDFAKDGKGFAGLTLQLLTGMKSEIAKLKTTNSGLNQEDLNKVIDSFQQLESRLEESKAQQEAYFKEISLQIDSGFKEVCERFGLFETTITQCLQSLEEKVEQSQKTLDNIDQNVIYIKNIIEPNYSTSRIPNLPSSYSEEYWRKLCRDNLHPQENRLTSNEDNNANLDKVPKLNDVYVPLAIVGGKNSKSPPRNQQEEKQEKEEKKLTPIAEEDFFNDVLREGKSESKGRRIAIIGEPGSGKTTRLYKIADWILEHDLGLPVWVDLRDLKQPSICHHIEEIWLKKTGENITIDALTQHKNRIWLLLDGLDEMTSMVQKSHVSALLEGWVQGARVVVTCRVNVWQAEKNAFVGFDVFRNLEFNQEEVSRYIRGWFGGIGEAAKGQSLEAKLSQPENSRLRDLIQNPLRLWMLCQTWQPGEGLPDTQAKLYKQFIDKLYGWKANQEILKKRQVINKALAQLALAAMEEENEVSRFRLPESWVLQVLGINEIFEDVLKLGLLNRVEKLSETICVFYHATFQEYFAALAVDNWDYFLPKNHVNKPVVGKKYRIFDPVWKQVILLWLGREDIGDKKKEQFISKLVNFDDGCGKWNFEQVDRGFYEYRAYFLAAAGVNEFKKSRSLASGIVKQLVKWWFGYSNIEKQEWETFLYPIAEEARKTLPETIRQFAITEINEIIENCQDEDTRRLAAKSLEKIASGNQEAIAGLISVIESADDEDTHRLAAESLGKIDSGNQEAIAACIRILETSDDGYIRRQAADTLEKIAPGNPQAVAVFIKRLETSDDEYIRREVADSLGKIGQGNPQAIAACIRILETSNNKETLWQAADSLGKIDPGNLQAVAVLITILETTTNNEDTHWQAAGTLWQIAIGNIQAIAACIRILETTDNEDTRMLAGFSLRKIAIGNPQAIADLIRILSTTDNGNTRRLAAESLREIAIGNPQAIADLIRIVSTTDNQEICRLAVFSLRKIGQENPQVIAVFIRILETTDNEKIRMLVAESLGEIAPGNPQAISALIRILETNHNQDIRRVVAESLEKIDSGNPQALSAFRRILETTDNQYTRLLTAYSLGQIAPGNPQAISASTRILETNDNEDIRGQAAYSLEKIALGNPQAIIDLIKLLETTDNESIYWQAASTLQKILTTPKQYADVVSALKNSLSDEVYRKNFERFNKCYKVVWQCAANLSYPDFYHAWHGLTETNSLNRTKSPQLLLKVLATVFVILSLASMLYFALRQSQCKTLSPACLIPRFPPTQPNTPNSSNP